MQQPLSRAADCTKVCCIGEQCYLLNLGEITLYTGTGRVNIMLFYRDTVLLFIMLKYE